MFSHPVQAQHWFGTQGRRARREFSTGWRVLTRVGMGCAALWLADRWLRRLIPLRVLVVFAHDCDVRASTIASRADLRARFLDRAETLEFARQAPDWFPPGFVEDALARDNRCFGVFEAARLVYSCWFATTPVPALAGVRVAVAPCYAYAYRAHTVADKRGLGLHVFGIAAADKALAAEGRVRAVAAYIEASNASSLLATGKIGDRLVGSAVVFRFGGRVHAVRSPGCARVGFTIDISPATGDSADLR